MAKKIPEHKGIKKVDMKTAGKTRTARFQSITTSGYRSVRHCIPMGLARLLGIDKGKFLLETTIKVLKKLKTEKKNNNNNKCVNKQLTPDDIEETFLIKVQPVTTK